MDLGSCSSDQVRRLAKNIYRSSRAIQELLQDLVGVAGGKTQAFEPCRLRDIVLAANQALAASEDAQSVDVELDIDESQEVPMQRFRMERVFLNLIGNAVEAMSSGGKVRISARPEGGFLVITVEDTGPGISPGDSRVTVSAFRQLRQGQWAGIGSFVLTPDASRSRRRFVA